MATKAKPGKTVGVYDRPVPPKWPKIIAIALAALILLVASVVLWGAPLAQQIHHDRLTISTQLGFLAPPVLAS